MSRTGRPKINEPRNRCIKIMLTEREYRELEEFAMLNHVNKSELIRRAIDDIKDKTRSRYGFVKSEFDEYYEENDYFEDEDELYND